MIDLRKFIDWVVAKQNIIGLVSTVIIILLSIYGYTQGVFTDKSKLEALLKSCGVWAPIMFVALQAIHLVNPCLQLRGYHQIFTTNFYQSVNLVFPAN